MGLIAEIAGLNSPQILRTIDEYMPPLETEE